MRSGHYSVINKSLVRMNLVKLGESPPRGVGAGYQGRQDSARVLQMWEMWEKINKRGSDLAKNRTVAPLPHGEPQHQTFSFEDFHAELIGCEYGVDFDVLRSNPSADRVGSRAHPSRS